jgi:hypothetical protein
MQVKRKLLRSSIAALTFALLITGTLVPTGTLRAQNAATTQETITPLITKDLAGSANEQVLMYTVEFPPGFSSPIHRHNAQVVVFKGTSNPVLGHAICKSGDTESDVGGGGAVLVLG